MEGLASIRPERCGLDGDGRPDLVVTQNGAQTVLGLSRRP